MPIPASVWNDLIDFEPGAPKNRGPLANNWGGDALIQTLIDAGHLQEQGGRVTRTKSSVDAAALWEVLPEDGSSMGNQRARGLLGWTSDRRYEAAKRVLLSTGEIGLGRGRGGSVRRLLSEEAVKEEPSAVKEAQGTANPSPKRPRLPKAERPPAAKSKEAQRAELHKTIWRIANDLRGSVDGWDFKPRSTDEKRWLSAS